MMQQQHRHEPQEREDPRNALLDTMAQQIVDMLESAVENEVIEPLLGRIEAASPALVKRLALLKEAAAAADAAAASVAPSDCPAGSRPLVASHPYDPESELRLSKVLAALKLGKPKTDAARDLLDGAKMIVLADLAALRAARSVLGARRLRSAQPAAEHDGPTPAAQRLTDQGPAAQAPAINTTALDDEQASLGSCPFIFMISDVGSGA